jgi:predicted RNA binding protein YcfA (HicA-like mRNA interferase family)
MRSGFRLKRQEGSHLVLRRDAPFAQVVVPDHKELATGTLRSLLRQADLSVAVFLRLL